MLTFHRNVAGLLHYRKVWFAGRAAALEIAHSLQANDVVRCFGASEDLAGLPHAVMHRQLRTSWVDLAAGPENILAGMKRKSCRYEIRRAEKMLDQVAIETGSAQAQRDFLAVYNDFAPRKRLPKFRAAWFQEYSVHAEPVVLYFQGQPLCCHLLLRDAQRGIVRLLHSGSRRLLTPEDAAACGALNRYLHWHEMQRYHREGFAVFDFGGIRGQDDLISRFKLSFGGAIVSEHYALLSGTAWLARLGNFIYERLRSRASFSKTIEPRGADSSSAAALSHERI